MTRLAKSLLDISTTRPTLEWEAGGFAGPPERPMHETKPEDALPAVSLDEILALLGRSVDEAYIGEPVSQLAHALMAADLAARAHASPALVAAALLHDVGHLCDRTAPRMASLGTLHHEKIGADFVRRAGFGEDVARPIEDHVRAKRYLVLRRPAYGAKLSEASTGTLAFQGGPMSEAEATAFEAEPGFKDALRLRGWDEQAKDAHWSGPSLDSYRPLLEGLLRSRQRDHDVGRI